MKRISTVAAILLFGCVACWQASAQDQDAGSIQTIRQQYASINRDAAKYRKVKKELSGFSTEGGELVAYFKGPSIMKLAATFFGESGKATEEYYYWNDKLIFVLRKESRYDEPLSGKVVATTEHRFYFQDDKLIRWIGENGEQVLSGKHGFPSKETDYLVKSKQFRDGARSRNRTIEDVP